MSFINLNVNILSVMLKCRYAECCNVQCRVTTAQVYKCKFVFRTEPRNKKSTNRFFLLQVQRTSIQRGRSNCHFEGPGYKVSITPLLIVWCRNLAHFATVTHFHLNLTFERKARAYPSGALVSQQSPRLSIKVKK